MRFLDKMERKFGRYAIRNLPLIMIILLVAGYTLRALFPSAANYYAFIPPYIMRGQVWRLITWVLMPPSSLDIFTVIMLLFYYWVARTLAATWGDFLFNIYIFGGIIITDIGMMLTYAYLTHAGTTEAYMEMMYIPAYMNTYYILTTILIAYALTYPNMRASEFCHLFPDDFESPASDAFGDQTKSKVQKGCKQREKGRRRIILRRIRQQKQQSFRQFRPGERQNGKPPGTGIRFREKLSGTPGGEGLHEDISERSPSQMHDLRADGAG